MNIFPLSSLGEDVHLRANTSVCDLWQFCLHVVREASKVLHIYASASLEILLNILYEGLPYDEVLGLGLEWLHAW